jgi:hypothetical protein
LDGSASGDIRDPVIASLCNAELAYISNPEADLQSVGHTIGLAFTIADSDTRQEALASLVDNFGETTKERLAKVEPLKIPRSQKTILRRLANKLP